MIAKASVAIIDDERSQADVIQELVVDAGMKPIQLHQKFANVAELVKTVRGAAAAAICDHRLSPGGLAQFSGAEAVASLHSNKIPAVLLTQFEDVDGDVSIRRWRDRVPVVLSRPEADNAQSIVEALDYCRLEIQGQRAPERRTQRCLVQVVSEIERVGDFDVVSVIVSQWKPHRAVRIPIDLIPLPLRPSIGPKRYLIANVNIDAETSHDLFFVDFGPAPDPLNL
jgi:hypothetical protein